MKTADAISLVKGFNALQQDFIEENNRLVKMLQDTSAKAQGLENDLKHRTDERDYQERKAKEADDLYEMRKQEVADLLGMVEIKTNNEAALKADRDQWHKTAEELLEQVNRQKEIIAKLKAKK